MNNEYSIRIRTVLNEIEAKEYILSVAKKYRVPRKEIEQTRKHLESCRRDLEKLLNEKQ